MDEGHQRRGCKAESSRDAVLLKRLAAIVESSSDAILSTDRDGNLMSWNPSAERLFGYSEREALGQPVSILAPADRRSEVMRILENLNKGIPIVHFETVRLRKDGQPVEVSLTISPLRDELGNIIGGSTILRDIGEEKKAQRALRQYADEVTDLYDNAPCGYHSLDKNGVFLRINKTELSWLGYEKDEVIGKNVKSFLTAASREVFSRNFPRFMGLGYIADLELEFVRKDGSILPIAVSGSAVKDEAGRMVATRSSLFDISKRKETEHALRESEAKYRHIVETTHEGIWVIDAESKTTFVNARMAVMLGLPVEKAIGRSMYDFMDDEIRKVASANVQKRKSGVAEQHEFHLKQADGRHLWTLMSTSPIFTSSGDYAGALAMVADISKLKESQEQREALLRQIDAEKTWLSSVIENSPLALFLVEAGNHEMVRVNRKATEILGIPVTSQVRLAEIQGRVFWNDGKPFDVADMLGKALSGGRMNYTELLVRRPDGVEVPGAAYVNPVLGGDGQLIGVMGVLEDISRLKRLERLREEWIGLVVHDLRQPVTSIMGRIELLRMQLEKRGVDIQTEAGQILQSAQQMNRLIGDLLDASNIESRHLVLKTGPVNAAQLVSTAVSRASPEMRAQPIEVDVSPGLPWLEADQGRLEQVVGNLLSNAGKYSYPGTAVRISAASRHSELLFAVTNQGEGVAPEEIHSIFERFRRSSGAMKKSVEGLGLGLYITKGLVEAHGGRIWAESIPGGATTFFFTIPLRHPQQKPVTD